MVVLYQLSYKGKILKTAVTLSDLGFCGNSNLEHMKNRREDKYNCNYPLFIFQQQERIT